MVMCVTLFLAYTASDSFD